MMLNSLFSEYYERDFASSEIEEAFDLYIEWCRNNNIDPEVTDLSEVNLSNLDHVLYHAEIQGFQIKGD